MDKVLQKKVRRGHVDPAEGNKVRRFQTAASDWVPSHRQHQVEFPFPPGFLVWQGGQPLPISSRFSSFPCCDPVHSPSKLSFLPHLLLILPVSLSLPSASLDSPCCRSPSPARPDLRHHLTLFQSRLCVCARESQLLPESYFISGSAVPSAYQTILSLLP